ncbi:hypothetical protein DFH28DRAFT_1079371 [Melampsora americana]|nr:hypothetical protein DFH28DRAFT_910306 [Melampsora americana]KAH9818329.1 hypothetical protein DFH28DRAFT_888324 [Melampsora americana]KAH9820468.1 hypothetical protein DFH28DRAFT_1079371 [Melampsora americana]
MSARKGGNNVAYECPHLPECFDPTSKGKPCQNCNGLNLTGVRKHTLNTRHHGYCGPACPVYGLTDLSAVKFERKKCSTPTPTHLPVASSATRSRTPSTERSSSPSLRARKATPIHPRESSYEVASSSDKESRASSSVRRNSVRSTSTNNHVRHDFSSMAINPEKFDLPQSHHPLPNAFSSTRETSQDPENVPNTSTSKNSTGDFSCPIPGLQHPQLDTCSAYTTGTVNQRQIFFDSQNLKGAEPFTCKPQKRAPAVPVTNVCYEESFRLDWKFGALLAVFVINLFWFIRAWFEDFDHKG